MDELSEVIDFCKNYYAKSPKERLKAQSTAKLDASPFKKIQEESPPDIATTLNKLTESLNKMDFTQKPYKPTLYPSGRGRGTGRGGRFQGRRSPGNLPTSPTEEEVVEVSEENPEVQSLTKALPKEFLGKTPKQKM